jgi:hypothetical protein
MELCWKSQGLVDGCSMADASFAHEHVAHHTTTTPHHHTRIPHQVLQLQHPRHGLDR